MQCLPDRAARVAHADERLDHISREGNSNAALDAKRAARLIIEGGRHHKPNST
jgi:hypothetical protein